MSDRREHRGRSKEGKQGDMSERATCSSTQSSSKIPLFQLPVQHRSAGL
jgi:hypothetical protein